MRTDVLIVGGGLSGLYLAYRLTREHRSFLLVEARDRFGGRILSPTLAQRNAETDARFDMGPAWMWPVMQPLLRQLLADLGLTVFAQYTEGAILYEDESSAAPQKFRGPSAHAQSHRLTGGAGRVIEQLAASLPESCLLLNHRVVRLDKQASAVEVATLDAQDSHARITAHQVVLALPPRLLARNVELVPAPPASTRNAWINTPTWMAGQAKAVVLYATPFWRTLGLSGEAFSRRGPLTEIYDASPVMDGPYALFGFFGISADGRRQLGEVALQQMCLAQLRRLFGEGADQPLAVVIKDWAEDMLTATADDRLAPAHHPAYGVPAVGRTLWDRQLIWAGSETAEISGGYLEGALEAAQAALAQIENGNR